MVQTTAVEFQRKFGEFQHQAQRELVEITREGRRELVLMSADHFDWLVAAARRIHRRGCGLGRCGRGAARRDGPAGQARG
jgi:prevent-host-death family protein